MPINDQADPKSADGLHPTLSIVSSRGISNKFAECRAGQSLSTLYNCLNILSKMVRARRSGHCRRGRTRSKSVRASGSFSGPLGQGLGSNASLGSPYQRSKFAFDRAKSVTPERSGSVKSQQFGRVICEREPNEPRRCRGKDAVLIFLFHRRRERWQSLRDEGRHADYAMPGLDCAGRRKYPSLSSSVLFK